MTKEKVLHSIYGVFDQWSKDLTVSCRRGCSNCCTQSVTITATEGVEILRYIISQDLSNWFVERLLKRDFIPPKFTTNDFAKACLEGKDVDLSPPENQATCPFLIDRECGIYPARPFSCRLFISQQTCSATQPALVPDHYFEATVAVSQLIEHLGQKEYWGNMLDVLPALLDISEFKIIGEKIGELASIHGKLQTLTAKPLPGFLISNEAQDRVNKLLTMIFQEKIEGKTIEDILNGK